VRGAGSSGGREGKDRVGGEGGRIEWGAGMGKEIEEGARIPVWEEGHNKLQDVRAS
jgi:hypothetical protein